MDNLFEERRVTTCAAHPQYEVMVQSLKEGMRDLRTGQTEMQMTLVQLTENLKGLERLERRVDKLEAKHQVDEKYQGDQIDELRRFMYKITGAIAVISVLAPLVMRGVMMVVL